MTVTGSPDPVLRGEWLQPGALVCAVGANDGRRASSTTSSSSARRSSAATRSRTRSVESGDLIEPVASGVLDWLEVHELQEVVAGEIAGRQSDDDIVVFKSNGLAAWDVAAAAAVVSAVRRERG